MKRILLILLLWAIAGVAVWYAVSLQGRKPVDRYYVGIGVQLYQVEEKVVAMYDDNGEEYSNEKQQLTGFVLVRGILKGSPAEVAGLRDMDVVVGLDGRNGPPSENVLSKAIRNGREGGTIRLKIRRIDKAGNTLNEFDTDVRRGIIDTVAWLSMDTWMTGSRSMCGPDQCDYNVSFSSMVHEMKDGRTLNFIYYYKLENSGTKPVDVRWKLERWHTWKQTLEPGQSIEYGTASKEFPAYIPREAKFTVTDKNRGWFTRSITWLSGSNEVKTSMPAMVPASEAK